MDTLVSNPQLKNRIFGAILLVILAVLLIPLFLGEPRNSLELIEPAPKAEFQAKIQLLPEGEKRIKPELLESPASQTLDTTASKSEQATGAVLKTIDVPKTVAAQQTAKPEQAAEVIKKAWALQVGLFSKKENALAEIKALRKHDFEPNFKLTQASSGEAIRVWLGPFENKNQVEKVSAKLKAMVILATVMRTNIPKIFCRQAGTAD